MQIYRSKHKKKIADILGTIDEKIQVESADERNARADGAGALSSLFH